jgi:hypothetical protein
MTFAQRRNRLTTHFTLRIVVKRRMTVLKRSSARRISGSGAAPFVTSAIESADYSPSRSGRFNPEGAPAVCCIESWADLKAGLVVSEKRKIDIACRGIKSGTVQQLAHSLRVKEGGADSSDLTREEICRGKVTYRRSLTGGLHRI